MRFFFCPLAVNHVRQLADSDIATTTTQGHAQAQTRGTGSSAKYSQRAIASEVNAGVRVLLCGNATLPRTMPKNTPASISRFVWLPA